MIFRRFSGNVPFLSGYNPGHLKHLVKNRNAAGAVFSANPEIMVVRVTDDPPCKGEANILSDGSVLIGD